jgi:membrane fusion protein (multidrug efflux system)
MPSEEPIRGSETPARAKPGDAPAAVGITVPPAAGDGRTHPPPPMKVVPPPRRRSPLKWLVGGVVAVAALAVALWLGIPWAVEALTTESTDDAYVNSYVTNVAPRVSGQVVGVFTDDNKRVYQGQKIVELDKVPYQVIVDLKQAQVELARADLEATKDQTRAQIATARGNRFKLQHTIEEVDNQVALLRANVAAMDTAQARLDRAKADFDRAKNISKTPGAISQQELDLKLQDFRVAETQVKQALEAVYQVRVGLGLPPRPEKGNDLTEVPDNLNQTFSSVRQASMELLRSAAPLGIVPSSFNLTPNEILQEFYRRDPRGDVDQIFAEIFKSVPAIKQAEAKLKEAEADLAQAELNLSYCDVYAEIDGIVTRRNVWKGNNLQAGQSLMAIRSVNGIWIDANFKETQLAKMRIGQQVRVEVDMYGSHKTFHGHITGFTQGTGSTLSLLPPQNATGNFVKVVQRLPVRIELSDYDPDKDPLFNGLSVTPYVYIKRPPEGENAGKFLQPYESPPPAPAWWRWSSVGSGPELRQDGSPPPTETKR